uniref:Uncharacterized protein n=1 Tax=Avena sativa TaxID=4498 RepID=A0ACD5ZI35_AVESA
MELMHIHDIDPDIAPPEKSIVLSCSMQNKQVIFLLDSRSTNSFLSSSIAQQLNGILPLPVPRRVKVAGGGILQCTSYIPNCSWMCGNMEFSLAFKILPLNGYDGILGMDWISSHSPQIIDWQHEWLALQYQGSWKCLQGNVPIDHEYRVIEIQLLQDTPVATKPLPTDIQSLLDAFASVFSTLEGLPSQRAISLHTTD